MTLAGAGYRISPLQRRLWRWGEGGTLAAYRARAVALVTGELDPAAWRAAVCRLVARHEILRTVFRCPPGVHIPLQVVLDDPPLAIPEPGRGPVRQGDPRALAEELLAAGDESGEQDGAPLSLALVPLDDGRHLLRLDLPALCADGPSLRLLLAELARNFAPGEEGEAPQYADLAEWQQQLLEGEEGREGAAYWRQRTPAAEPGPRLHCERTAAPAIPVHPLRRVLRLPARLARRLDATSGEQGLSWDAWLLGCWSLLLWRLAGEEEVPLGVAADGRSYEDLSGAIGLLARYLPLRGDLAPELPFLEAARRIATTRLAGERWQEYFTWEAPGEAPFFRFAFEAGSAVPAQAAGGAGPRFLLLAQSCRIDRCGLALSALRTAAGDLDLAFESTVESCDPAALGRLGEQLTTLLRDSLARPAAPVGELRLAGPAERRRLRVFQGAPLALPPRLLLHAPFEEQAARWPDRPAVEAAGAVLSYGELDARAERAAALLTAGGAGPETIVGLCFERSVEQVVALLAILKAGAAYLPLDPDDATERLGFLLEDSGAPLVLTSSRWVSTLPTTGRSPRVVCLEDPLPAEQVGARRGDPLPDQPAYVLYTSGSTGRPKGVVVCHGSAASHMVWMRERYPLEPADAVLQKTSLSFDAAVWEIHAPLGSGARLVLARPGGQRDPAYLAEALVRHGITTLQVVPSLLRLLLAERRFAAAPGLRRVFCGGEVLTPDLAARCRSTLGAGLINLYGPTETTIQVVTWDCGPKDAEGRPVPIGRPIANCRVHVLDRGLRPVPIGMRGELFIAGVPVSRGYLNRPQLSAERFLPDPWGPPGARMYRTGDFASWRPDGVLDFHGRMDQQVKLRGYRVELGEIETVAERHPAVRQAVCLVDETGLRLTCFYQATGPAADLRDLLAAQLPPYMVPSLFVPVEAFPTTASGKVDRRALPGLAERPAVRGRAVAPRDPLELRLAQIWERVLRVSPVGVTDRFFDLGGHSLLAVTLLSEVERELGRGLPLASLFQAPTIEAQAEVLRGEASGLLRSILVPVRAGDAARPLFIVHPAGGNVLCYLDLVRHLPPGPAVYALQDPSLYDESTAAESIEEMASLYAAAVREVQPEGPYLLAGWSSGGVVAFEMAQQLQSQGGEVGLLALFDSQVAEEEGPVDDRRLGVSVARLLAFLGGIEPPQESLAAIAQADRSEVVERLAELARQARLLPPGQGPEQVDRFYEVFRRNVNAVQRYRPREYARRITLFRATDELPEAVRDAAVHRPSASVTLGWERIGSVRALGLPGNHLSMIAAPHVAALAHHLGDAITQTNRVYDLGRRTFFWMLGH